MFDRSFHLRSSTLPRTVVACDGDAPSEGFRVGCGIHLSAEIEAVRATGAAAHRAALAIARERGWDAVLVLAEEALPVLDGGESLDRLSELPDGAEAVHFNGVRGADYSAEAVSPGVRRVRGGLRAGSATMYRSPFFDRALRDLASVDSDPDSLSGLFDRWHRDEARRIYALEPWPFSATNAPLEKVQRDGPIWIARGYAPTSMLVLVSRFHQFMVALVAKNGTNTLKRVVGVTEPEVALRMAAGAPPHPAVGFHPNGKWMIEPELALHPKYDHYTRFFVWRDPLERLRSVARWMHAQGPNWRYGRWSEMIREGLTDLDWLRRNFEALVDAELALRATSTIDQHLRPQSASFAAFPCEVIVPLPRLYDFMRERFDIAAPAENRTEPLALGDELEQAMSRIVQNHYLDDYRILESGVPVFGGAVARSR